MSQTLKDILEEFEARVTRTVASATVNGECINTRRIFAEEYQQAILEWIKKEIVPNKQIHWIQHGDIGHPHETEVDIGFNKCRQQMIERIGKICH